MFRLSGRRRFVPAAIAVAALVVSLFAVPANVAAAVNGAIYTTNVNCERVNQNLFLTKQDVYLNGGPDLFGAGLTDGNYYVRVESPEGTVLGQSPTPNFIVQNGAPLECYQVWALTGGYADTDNPGAVYKVLISPTLGFPSADTKSDNFRVAPRPSLTLSKFQNVTTYDEVGDRIIYTYRVFNSGNVDLGPAQFTVADDRINAGAPFACGPAGTTLTPNLGTPGDPSAGSSVTCTATYTITQADLDAGTVTNTATAYGAGQTSNQAQATVGARQQRTLGLRKSAQPGTYAAVGTVITYTYTVLNTGNVTLGPAQFVVTDDRIGGLAFPCGPAGTSLTSNLGTFLNPSPGSFVTCTADYVISQADLNAGSVTNTAFAFGAGLASTVADATVNSRPGPALTLAKVASPTTYDAVGDLITYTYTIVNTGNVNIGPAQFTVTDDHIGTPPGTPFTCGPAGTTLVPNTVALRSPTPGSFVTCTAAYTVTQADLNAGSVTNAASASGGGVTAPTVEATVDADQNPRLTLAKVASPTTYDAVGDLITYTYTIVNSGNVSIGPGPISVFDDHIGSPAGSPFFCGQGILMPNTGTPVNPSPGSFVTCTATYGIRQADLDAGTVTNTAWATGSGKDTNRAQATVTAQQQPAISLRKSVLPLTFATVGSVVTYTYTIVNTGNVTLGPTQFEIDDDHIGAPPGTPFACGPAATVLKPNAGTLVNPTPGSFVTCTADYTITQADLNAGSVTNSANALGAGLVSGQAQATAAALQGPALTLTKTATPPIYTTVGQLITYSYTIVNTGNIDIGPAQFTVSDDHIGTPPGTPFDCGPAGTTLVPNVAALRSPTPGAFVTCEATYTITQADLDAGSVTNTAGASGGGSTAPPVDATVNADQNPSLGLTKTPSPLIFAAAGDVITYSYGFTNGGNVTLVPPFTVTDDKATVTCPQPASLAPGATIVCTASYTISAADVDAGLVVNTAFAGAADPAANPIVSNQVQAIVIHRAPGPGPQPAMTIVKRASPANLPAGGGTVTYTYAVTNSGNTPLVSVSVSDDKCAPVTFTGGDTNGNGILDVGETWTYACTTTITTTTTNVGTATANSAGGPTTAADDATVTVDPAIATAPPPSPSPTGSAGVSAPPPSARPTPTSDVEGATNPPFVTLPPTDGLGFGSRSEGATESYLAILIVLVALGAFGAIVARESRRSRR